MKIHFPHRHFRSSRACLLALVSVLAGCAQYRPALIHPAVSASALMARRLDQPKLHRFLTEMGVHPHITWSLHALTLVAVYERPELKVSVAAYDAAKAAIIIARQIPNPTLSLSPTVNATHAFPSPIKIGPVISFLISNLGAREAGIAAAQDRRQAARTLIAAAAWRERASVRDALLTLWLDEHAARLKRLDAAYATTAADLIAQRVRSGMLAETALAAATETADAAEFDATEAGSRIGVDRAHLAATIGMPAAALRGVKLGFNMFSRGPAPPLSLPSLIRTALVTRPSVVAALARYQAADAALREAIDQQFPGFQIGPGYHYDQGDNKFIISLSLPLPILNQNQGPVAEARARRHLAAAAFDQVQAHVLRQIDSAEAALRGSRTITQSAQHLVTIAGQREQQATQAFRAGATGRLRMVEAKRQAVLAREQALTAKAKLLHALAHLADALHHPIFEENPA